MVRCRGGIYIALNYFGLRTGFYQFADGLLKEVSIIRFVTQHINLNANYRTS